MNNDVKYTVIDLLKELPVYKPNSIGTQHVVRCPYCGDSKTESHGHFSINIDVNSDTPMKYRCFKCDIAGLLTADVLEELQLPVSSDMSTKIRYFNKHIIKQNNHVNTNTSKYIVPQYQDSILNNKKLSYINQRLGTSINYIEAQSLKIILDIFEFIKLNEIKDIPNFSVKYIENINNNYVGWLSTNNNCITWRRVTDDSRMKRYIKMILNPYNLNANTFYSIPNSLDLLYTNDIHIHISEGIFDILSVYKNVKDSNLENNYYYASCGFGYITILKYLISNGINTGLNVHIYSDKDKTDEDHIKYLFKQSAISYWIKTITFHRNAYEGEKDYGVIKEKIIDTQYKIKR